jgi:hypothetical protein
MKDPHNKLILNIRSLKLANLARRYSCN